MLLNTKNTGVKQGNAPQLNSYVTKQSLIYNWTQESVCDELKRLQRQGEDIRNHRPSSNVFVSSVSHSCLLEEEAEPERDLLTTYAGRLGIVRLVVSLPSMKSTFDMVGRSPGSSCTHKSPTLTHLSNSFVLQV